MSALHTVDYKKVFYFLYGSFLFSACSTGSSTPDAIPVLNAGGVIGGSGAAGSNGAAPAKLDESAGKGAAIASGGVQTTQTKPAAGAAGVKSPVAGTKGGNVGAAGASNTPTTPAGPDDGDPSSPMVAVADLACGGPTGFIGSGLANYEMDGRSMIVTYPCNKHAGAPMTFILNLHGTTPVEQHFYQHMYFSAHQFAASHNLIVVTPSSVVQQWGNGDNGEDEPHLMKIIEWVYSTFSGPGKFDIRAMWVGGHSWGGMYTAIFGCKAELADKVKGLIMMSGGTVGGFGGASCASKVSVILSTSEGDSREPADQTTLATSHGCGAAQTEQIITNNKYTYWPDCNPGFAHANYYMLGKQHATFMDKEVVQSIVDWIKKTRQ
jgi:hypothetical protein